MTPNMSLILRAYVSLMFAIDGARSHSTPPAFGATSISPSSPYLASPGYLPGQRCCPYISRARSSLGERHGLTHWGNNSGPIFLTPATLPLLENFRLGLCDSYHPHLPWYLSLSLLDEVISSTYIVTMYHPKFPFQWNRTQAHTP